MILNLMIYPLTIGGACIITSIIGTWFVKLGKSKSIMGALYKGFIVTAITSLIIMYPVTDNVGLTARTIIILVPFFRYGPLHLWYCRFFNNRVINFYN